MNRNAAPRRNQTVPSARLTPAGLQSTATIARRRLLVLALNLATLLAFAALAARIAGAGGWTALDIVFFLCVLAATPWGVIGFWNAAIGLALLHGSRKGVEEAAPVLNVSDEHLRVTSRTAVLMTLRNEDPARAIRRLRAVKRDLDATPHREAFDFYLLSDTCLPEVAAAEEAAVASWRAQEGERVFYRRRASNEGFKAGNIRDFCDRFGHHYDFMLPLDADSLMGAGTVLRMVAVMQAYPRLGLLQSLVVGLPSASAFARIFQFGMRHGMRCYTLGSAWWGADCGPFWGHNALVRIAPFSAACDLPVLTGGPPLGGHVLSHDQVEAVLMRRAGFEVRVLPIEQESYEENPPALTDFVKRDLRWCLGNMQYLKLMDMPGLLPMSRFQLAWAVLMFAAVPAYPLLMALTPFLAAEAAGMEAFPAFEAAALYLTYLFVSLTPKLAGLADVALTRNGAARYGGRARFALSAVLEIVFAFLLGAVTAFAVARFLLSLAFGRVRSGWGAQARDAHALSLATAVRHLWVPTLFGVLVTAGLLFTAPSLVWWAAPLLAGYLLAIPFAMATADPCFGAWLAARGLCATPEERDPPRVFALLEEAPDLLEEAA